MARYGIKVADFQQTIEVALGGKIVGQVFEGDRRLDIVVRLHETLRTDLGAISRLPIPITRKPQTGLVNARLESEVPDFVPLGEVASIELTQGPNQISRENGKRRIFITCPYRILHPA